MQFDVITIDPAVTRRNEQIEKIANTVIRGYDRAKTLLRLNGRKAPYDDLNYEFVGGPSDKLRMRHYDKSLRLLWKAEEHVEWSSFRDLTKNEKQLRDLAEDSLNASEKQHVKRMRSEEFTQMLDSEYSREQKQAIVNILSLIGHGEAYAWMVSTEVLNDVQSTGARAAVTMQVLEEAKHFVVLRELIQAFDCPIPRMNAWEYLLLERTFKAKGLEKFFGMNVIVESFALSLFGMMGTMPGLEVLRLFHLDESRHTALPKNYFEEFPMSWWQTHRPSAQAYRLSLVLPAIPILGLVERDLGLLGIDVFEFGGSMARKILFLADRAGFKVGVPREGLEVFLDWVFNLYCQHTRPNHVQRNFIASETTTGVNELAIEAEVFGLAASA